MHPCLPLCMGQNVCHPDSWEVRPEEGRGSRLKQPGKALSWRVWKAAVREPRLFHGLSVSRYQGLWVLPGGGGEEGTSPAGEGGVLLAEGT